MEERIRFDDGAETTLESWGSTGPVLLCVHGITSSRRSWTRFAERFSLAYRVFAYDQRGHGDSADVHGPMTLERGVRDLAEIVRRIGEPIYGLIGHSWGGAVAILGGRRSEAVQRVVAIDPMIHQKPGWRDEFVVETAAMLDGDREQREMRIYEDYAGWHELDIQGKIHAMQFMSIEPIERLGTENRVDEGGWDLRDDVADYPKPLLLLLAGEDSIIPAEDVEPLRLRSGAKTSIETFAGEGHNLHRTAFDRFANSVDDFFTRTAQPAAPASGSA